MNRVSQDPSYHALKTHVIESTGLAFYADRDELLAELIGERLSALELSDCSAYGAFLANGEAGQAEMDVLIAQLTIGETYFFRDQSQFEAIRDVILPDIMERKKDARELRIWSAGCATGPEPYSLAILLADEMAGQVAGWQISIYATDLNREYLAQAARGKYRDWAFRDTPEAVRGRCFTKEGHLWAIHSRYKEWIEFRQMNLIASQPPQRLPAHTRFDLILCRNVMIYFAPEVVRALIGRFHESLAAGGGWWSAHVSTMRRTIAPFTRSKPPERGCIKECPPRSRRSRPHRQSLRRRNLPQRPFICHRQSIPRRRMWRASSNSPTGAIGKARRRMGDAFLQVTA